MTRESGKNARLTCFAVRDEPQIFFLLPVADPWSRVKVHEDFPGRWWGFVHPIGARARRRPGLHPLRVMPITQLSGLIARRILLNYQVEPSVASRLLPHPFRAKLVQGKAIAGICLIRLERIRPQGVPSFIGISSENSAHRIAVEWSDESGRVREGVFVMRRDSDSAINALLGGRFFPGPQHLSLFSVQDWGNSIRIRVDADDFLEPLVELDVETSRALPHDSVFSSLDDASDFFQAGCVGYSLSQDGRVLERLRMDADDWKVTPLKVHGVRSACFDDPLVFPRESIRFDHALIMRDIAHSWHVLSSWAHLEAADCVS